MQAGPEESPNANASPNTKDPITGAILPPFNSPAPVSCRIALQGAADWYILNK
jgi:hypothetical protein